jgi:hypothetical protein
MATTVYRKIGTIVLCKEAFSMLIEVIDDNITLYKKKSQMS